MDLEFLFLVGDDNGLIFRAAIKIRLEKKNLTYRASTIIRPRTAALNVGLQW